jgi:hypothetical protein
MAYFLKLNSCIITCVIKQHFFATRVIVKKSVTHRGEGLSKNGASRGMADILSDIVDFIVDDDPNVTLCIMRCD